MEGEAVAVLVYLASVAAGSAAIYGILTARSMLRLLVSIEVLFNSIVVSASYIGAVVSHQGRRGFYTVLLPVILLTIVELAILLAIVVLVHRTHGSLDTEVLGETRG